MYHRGPLRFPRATELFLSRVVSGRHLSEIPSKSIHHSGYAIDEFGRMKVHQKAQAAPGEPDVGVDLREMHGKDL